MIVGVATAMLGFWPALAVAGEKPASKEARGSNIEQMVQQAAANIARRYDLNRWQREYTWELVCDRLNFDPRNKAAAWRWRCRLAVVEFDRWAKRTVARLRK